jgi:hypothetical protein
MFCQIVVEGNKKKALQILKDEGYFVSGKDGKWIIRLRGARLFEKEKDIRFEIQAIQLTEKRILESEDFVKLISLDIYKVINAEPQKNATAVLGIGDLGRKLADKIAELINEERRGNGDLTCESLHGSISKRLFSLTLEIRFNAATRPKNDKIIFVHCDCDSNESLTKKVDELCSGFLQSIVLPVPHEQYQAFLEKIKNKPK